MSSREIPAFMSGQRKSSAAKFQNVRFNGRHVGLQSLRQWVSGVLQRTWALR
jgi:hypothetical protein